MSMYIDIWKDASGRDLATNIFWSNVLVLSIIFLMLIQSCHEYKKCICHKNRMDATMLQHLHLYAKWGNKEIQLLISDQNTQRPICYRFTIIEARLCEFFFFKIWNCFPNFGSVPYNQVLLLEVYIG